MKKKNKIYIILVICTVFIFLFSCKRENLITTCKICAMVIDSNNIPVDSAKIEINVDGDNITSYAYSQSNGEICFDKLEPNIYNFKVSKKGYNSIQQSIDITDEQQSQNFIIDKIIALFGKDTVINITGTSATAIGTITDLGYMDYVTQHGHCWSSLNHKPTLNDNKTTLDSLTNPSQFSSSLTGLYPNTTYYVRTYATNSLGTVYSNTISFTTESISIPVVITNAISHIGETNAIGGGNVTSDGSSPLTAKGICWSTSQNPTISNPHTTNGSGLGIFSSSLTNLSGTTKYYVRAYATNILGTAYGNQVSFTTLFNCGTSTITDYDGNNYNTVRISTQCWFMENLKTAHYNEGSTIPNASWWYYNNNSSNNAIYGKLYTWFVVSNSTLCPTGWHVPTDAEWTTLVNYLGGASVAGGKMKSIGTSNWAYPNTGATNSSGFTGLPGGTRNNVNQFVAISQSGCWWTFTEVNPAYAKCKELDYNNAAIGSYSGSKIDGLSVRCIKD